MCGRCRMTRCLGENKSSDENAVNKKRVGCCVRKVVVRINKKCLQRVMENTVWG